MREGKYAATEEKLEGTFWLTRLLTLSEEAVEVCNLGEATGEMVPCEATEMLLLARLCSPLGDIFASRASLLVLVSVLLLCVLCAGLASLCSFGGVLARLELVSPSNC